MNSLIEMGLDHCLHLHSETKPWKIPTVETSRGHNLSSQLIQPSLSTQPQILMILTPFELQLILMLISGKHGIPSTLVSGKHAAFWTLFGALSDQKGWNHKLRTDVNKAINKSTQELLCSGDHTITSPCSSAFPYHTQFVMKMAYCPELTDTLINSW